MPVPVPALVMLADLIALNRWIHRDGSHPPQDMPTATSLDPDSTLAVVAAVGDILAARGDWLTIKDVGSGTYAYANRVVAADLGREPGTVVGATDGQLFDALTAAALRAVEAQAAAGTTLSATEHEIGRGGARRVFVVQRVLLPVGAGQANRWLLSVWRDVRPLQQQADQLRSALAQIEEQHRQNEQLRRELAEQGSRDMACGLQSRTHFDDYLRREVDLSQREHREFAIVFVAVDEPAEPHERHASESDAAARVLAAVGQLLRAGTRAMDASCRWSDDRFAVLLSGVGLATAHSRMEGLRRQCATQIVVLGGQQLRFTVSMGVASYPHTADSAESLLRAGDAALQEARRRGGNQVTLASIRLDPG